MFEVAQAVFFHQYHSANTHRANRPISGAPVDADMSVHSHMVTPTQIHPRRTQQSYLCPLNGAAHTWLKSQEMKSQSSWLSTGSGRTLSKLTHMSTFRHSSSVFCVWLWFNRWAALVLLYYSIYLNSSLSPGLRHRCRWRGRASCQVYVIKAADMNEAGQTHSYQSILGTSQLK